MESLFNPATVSRRELFEWTLRVLNTYGVRPRKKLSQNFVVEPRLIGEILENTAPVDTIEIGCGIGTLSLALLTRVPRLLCVEIDRRLCEVAADVVKSPRFTVVNADADKYTPGAEQVVSNIPYHVTSDLLVKVARANRVKRAVLTLQREVAERLTAKPGSRTYGKLTILANTLFRVAQGGVYTPASFYPEPEVFHGVVVLERKREYDEEVCALEELTRSLFRERRKLAEKVLARRLGVRVENLGSLGRVIAGKRVFMLSSEVLLELAKTLREMGVIACKQSLD
jgi:16S rRNA (adenine1518-N6/adenine1519-N6)-dimethyltransferase